MFVRVLEGSFALEKSHLAAPTGFLEYPTRTHIVHRARQVDLSRVSALTERCASRAVAKRALYLGLVSRVCGQ